MAMAPSNLERPIRRAAITQFARGDGLEWRWQVRSCGSEHVHRKTNCSNNGTVSVLFGNGDGSFQAPELTGRRV